MSFSQQNHSYVTQYMCMHFVLILSFYSQEVAPEVGNHRGETLCNHSGSHSCSLVQCDLIQTNVWEWVPWLERLHEGVCI